MKIARLGALVVALMATLTFSGAVCAQHGHDGDIVLGYDSLATPSAIILEGEAANTISLYEADFPQSGPGAFETPDPGFTTENAPDPGDQDYLFVPGHHLYLRAVNAGTHIQGGSGLGFVNFHNGSNGYSISASGRMQVLKGSGSIDVNNTNGSLAFSSPLFVATADVDGDIHSHVDFLLNSDFHAQTGAYGILFQFMTRDAGNNDVASSNPFWIVFNNGLDQNSFENAVSSFGSFQAVPEPGSGLLCAIALGALAFRRRRK
ncbi:MAG: PEP-CTERM sorting domain-containing protein [Planctomycetaceae bacterium]|nr:PEP-CTERM sorting domain-containing protein [Planctomycetaceae bacterium]